MSGPLVVEHPRLVKTERNKVSTERLVFNGVNGATGTYGLAPMTDQDLAKNILEGRAAEMGT